MKNFKNKLEILKLNFKFQLYLKILKLNNFS